MATTLQGESKLQKVLAELREGEQETLEALRQLDELKAKTLEANTRYFLQTQWTAEELAEYGLRLTADAMEAIERKPRDIREITEENYDSWLREYIWNAKYSGSGVKLLLMDPVFMQILKEERDRWFARYQPNRRMSRRAFRLRQ